MHQHRIFAFITTTTILVSCLCWGRWASDVPLPDVVEYTEPDTRPLGVAVSHVDPMLAARRHLDQAESRILAKITDDYPLVDGLFHKAHGNIEAYVKVCLGWGSKWRIAADAMPFTSGRKHERYMREQFEKMIFSGADLEEAIQQSVNEFMIEVRSIESAMLVDLRADIPDLPEFAKIKSLSREELEAAFADSIQNAIDKAGSDFRSTVSSQVVSLVAGEVVTQVALRLGISAGVLGTGAASGWATFGIGVVVGLVIDQLVSRVWDWMYEPDVELAIELAKKLEAMRTLICIGDEQTQGLKGQFLSLAESRNKIRREAIESMMRSAMESNQK